MSDVDEHLDAQTLYLLEEGSLDPEQARQARAHLATCGSCQAEAKMAHVFAQTSSAPLDADVEQRLRHRVMTASTRRPLPRRRGRPVPRWVVGGLLAASLTAAAVGIWQSRPGDLGQPSPSNLRGTTTTETWQLQVTRIQDGWHLSWQPQPEAREYLVRLQAATGRAVWSRSTEATSLRLTEDELSSFSLDEEAHFVSVLYVHEGKERSSPPVRLRLQS